MWKPLQQEIRLLLLDDDSHGGLLPAGVRRVLRFWVMVGQSFARNRCPVRATALAYSSLLAFIPLLAIVVGVSTSVLKNDADRIQNWIKDSIFRVAPQLQNSEEFGVKVDTLVKEVNEMITNVHSGAVGTTGVLALLVMILFMLARVEETLNDIWGATRGRSWFSRLVNYWAAISLGPIVLFSAIGLSATINVPSMDGSVGKALVGLLQIPVLTLACAAFYAFMPNIKVQWRAALFGGLIAGILWYLNNTVSTRFVSQLTRNKAIYGSLAAIPVFMVGLYFFWMLLLFGAQAACTFQNRRSHLTARQVDRVNQEGRERVGLRLMLECARAFAAGRSAPSVTTLADQLEVPGELVTRITAVLLHGRLLVEAAGSGGEAGFVPARPLDSIRVADVLTVLRRGVGRGLAMRRDATAESVEREWDRVEAAATAAGSRTMAELVVGRLPESA